MPAPLLPGRVAWRVLAATPVAALAVGAVEGSVRTGWHFFLGTLAFAAAWLVVDVVRTVIAWRAAPLQWHRRLPPALALGVPHTVACTLVNGGRDDWWVELAENVDPSFELHGLPLSLYVPGHSRVELHYTLVPRGRGEHGLGPAALVVRTLHGSLRWRSRLGAAERLRVYPDYTLVARYDRLAAARRLAEMGIHAPHRSDEADGAGPRCLWLMLDGGPSLAQRFEEALQAMLLLAHVALRAGDAVGAMIIVAGGDEPRTVPPRRGPGAWPSLLAALRDVQPASAPSDYPSAAAALMEGQRGRARVLVLTGVRDRGTSDLRAALRLLRTRHEVWVAGGSGEPSPLPIALVNRYLAARAEAALNSPA
jgi:uncharacterized protein (DUF58 family)